MIWPNVQSPSPSAQLTRVAVASVLAVGGALTNITGDKVVTVRPEDAGNMVARPDLDAEMMSARACLTASLSAHHT